MSSDNARKNFNEKLLELNHASSDRSLFLDNERYERIVQEVKDAQLLRKLNQPLTSKHYRRLRRYDILQIDDEEKLIENIGAVGTVTDESNVRGYCKLEELFDVLERTHLSTGHKKTRIMEAELKKKYCNVTRQVIDLYIAHCDQCQQKKLQPKRKLVTPSSETTTKRAKDEFLNQSPILTEYMDVRGQIEIIDMQSVADEDYHFILNYQDQLTKFTILRPLKTKTAQEVAEQLVDIFCLFGAPFILQCSSNGREFACLITQKLTKLWPKLKLVHGKKPIGRYCDEFKYDVRELLLNWMSTKKAMRWSEALRFVQCEMNRTIHDGIEMSPHMAMFGMTSHHGLSDAQFLSDETLADIETEEELEKLFATEMEKVKKSEKIENEIQVEAEAMATKEAEASNADNSRCQPEHPDFNFCIQNIELAEKVGTLDYGHTFSITESVTAAQNQGTNCSNSTSPPVIDIGTNVLIKLTKEMSGDTAHAPYMALAVVVSVSSDGRYELATRNRLVERLYERHEIITTDNEFIDATQGELGGSLSLLLADKFWN